MRQWLIVGFAASLLFGCGANPASPSGGLKPGWTSDSLNQLQSTCDQLIAGQLNDPTQSDAICRCWVIALATNYAPQQLSTPDSATSGQMQNQLHQCALTRGENLQFALALHRTANREPQSEPDHDVPAGALEVLRKAHREGSAPSTLRSPPQGRPDATESAPSSDLSCPAKRMTPPGTSGTGKEEPESAELPKSGHMTIWQIPAQDRWQNMSYVIRTAGGKVIVIDGGNPGADAIYLRRFLKALGNHVDAWWITHPHPDHIGALADLLGSPEPPRIDKLIAALPKLDWIKTNEPDPLLIKMEEWAYHRVICSRIPIFGPQPGWRTTLDGVTFTVLGSTNPEIHENALNNSSLVFRVEDASKSVLFLGDLGEEGGQKLLRGRFGDSLHADYVQMAHHGQHGVSEEVYKAIRPTYCLWPTPRWLWENDNGKGFNSGKWETLQTRKWMDELGTVKAHYPSYAGLKRID